MTDGSPTSLAALLERSATEYPDRIALVGGGARLSYAELDAAANRTAHLLVRSGLRAGEAVALDCRNVPEFVIAYYAVLKAGAVVVPLHVLIAPAALARRLDDAGAALLVCVVGPDELPSAATAREAVARSRTCRGIVVVDGEHPLSDLIRDLPAAFASRPVPPDATAVIAYPRRSPGEPRGVVLTHHAMLHNAAAVTRTLYGDPSPTVHLIVLPLFHLVTQTMQLNAGIGTGATLVLSPRFEPRSALQMMAAEGVTTLVATPSMLWAMACAAEAHPEEAHEARASLRLVCSELAPLPRAVRVAVAERLGLLALEGFGLSETGMVALHARAGDARPESVGIPVEGVEARLVDSRCRVIDGAGTGELQVRGPGVMREYLHDPAATTAVFQDGWYRTGNIARRGEDGHYVMVDRPTHLIMQGGLTVYRRVVEEALLTHPAISSAKVVGVPHPRHGEELRTVIERDPAAVVSEAELVEWARQQLPGLTESQVEVSGVPPAAGRGGSIRAGARRLLPGIGVVVAGTAAAFLVNLGVAFLSPLTAAVLLGVILANTVPLPASVRPGIAVSTRRLLRAGVVFLGLQLSLPELAGLGAPLLAVVVVTVVTGFVGTRWVGERLGLSRDLSLLTASGFAICGASAIAAMEGASDADEEEVATAVALVTIFGSIALFAWPLLQAPLGLGEEAYGAWSGASVHEVAQVVAAAAPAGAAALATAVVVKLARVVLLAPLIAAVAVARRRSRAGQESGRRPPLVPVFVLGFLAMVVIRSTGVLPSPVLDAAKTATTALLAAALFGLGTGVRVRVLLATGVRAMTLGAISTVVIAAIAYGGVLLAAGAG